MSIDYADDRRRMVTEQLERRGVRHPGVLAAMERIPREVFVPAGLRGRAYDDGALPIDCGQTISQPFMVAKMTELLNPGPEDTVLEVGTGTGYQTAVLAALAGQVYTVEYHQDLMRQAADRLADLGVSNVAFRCGDGSLGWMEHAPFSGIMVTAGAPETPAPLGQQLTEDGRMVVPVGPVADQTLTVVTRGAGGLQETPVLKCRFVKLVGEAGWASG
jgi:protein-L-isoaspartate(D-aspartate) O-methyltransferase